jgi:phosphoglycerate dehydrogenase-like enzyme
MSGADVVVVSEHLDAEAASWLGRFCRVVFCAHDDPRFARTLASAAGLIVRTYTRVDGTLLDAAPRLRVVGRAGAGLDNIDVTACRARGIEVVYTPDSNTQAVVEYVYRLLLEALRPAVSLAGPPGAARWNELRAAAVGERELSELCLGILGLGRVGRRVAEVARGFRVAAVLYNDLVEVEPPLRFGAVPVDAPRLFSEADVVSVHIDGRSSNRRFVGAALLRRMKPRVIFINTSRGFVVDNVALAAFLGENPQALALLDVHDPEPFDEGYPLLGRPNVRLFPHLGSRTEAALRAMSGVVRDVSAVLEGRSPLHPAPPHRA